MTTTTNATAGLTEAGRPAANAAAGSRCGELAAGSDASATAFANLVALLGASEPGVAVNGAGAAPIGTDGDSTPGDDDADDGGDGPVAAWLSFAVPLTPTAGPVAAGTGASGEGRRSVCAVPLTGLPAASESRGLAVATSIGWDPRADEGVPSPAGDSRATTAGAAMAVEQGRDSAALDPLMVLDSEDGATVTAIAKSIASAPAGTKPVDATVVVQAGVAAGLADDPVLLVTEARDSATLEGDAGEQLAQVVDDGTRASATNDTDATFGAVAAAIDPAGRTAGAHRTASIPTPVHAPNWGHDVAGEIRVLVNHRTESATLRLTPADLGPIEVQIRFDGDAASVQLAASHPETRAALESALPRLREMFAGHGLQLADAGVSGQRQHGGRDDAPATPSRPALANATPNTRTIASVAIGQIDDYA